MSLNYCDTRDVAAARPAVAPASHHPQPGRARRRAVHPSRRPGRDVRRDPPTDQPVDPGPARPRRHARHPPRRAVEEPSGGAHQPDGIARQRLRAHPAPPDGLARRSRLRDRRRRDRMPRLRRRPLRRASRRAQGAVPGSHPARIRPQRRRRRLPGARRPVRAGAARRARRRPRGPLHDRLHRRDDRTPQGRADEPSGVAGDDVDPDGGVGVPRRVADRDRHAAVARRDVARRARAAVGRSVLRDGVVHPRRVLRPRRGASHHGDADRPGHALRAAGTSALRDGRHVVDGDDLLRGVADEPGQACPGDRALGPDLLPVLRADRGADGDHPPEEGRARPRPAPSASRRAADRCRGCTSPCSTPTTGRWRPASPARSAPAVRS